jgi:hypothetical protein
MNTKRNTLYVRLGKLGDDDTRQSDYQRWNQLGDDARFKAAWELVVQAYEIQGKDLNELRLQRSIENLIRK